VISANGGGGGKIRTLVKFPLSQLDMRPFTTGTLRGIEVLLLVVFLCDVSGRWRTWRVRHLPFMAQC
jgi:hypothetical protein